MRRVGMWSVIAAVLALPQCGSAQVVSGYRYTMTGQQTSAMPGQPEGPRAVEVRAQVAAGMLRMDYVAGGGPFGRPGVFMLVNGRNWHVLLIDSTARQQVSFMESMSTALTGLAPQMTISDTSSVLEDLGPGETVVGYPTRKFRQTVRYSMGMSEMPETKTSMVQITTLHVSDAVAALDPGFSVATSMALTPMGQAPKRSKLEEVIWTLASNLPKGFALIAERDTRITSGQMEMATASSMRITELTRAQLSATAVGVPTGLTPTDYMAYMTRAMQAKP